MESPFFFFPSRQGLLSQFANLVSKSGQTSRDKNGWTFRQAIPQLARQPSSQHTQSRWMLKYD